MELITLKLASAIYLLASGFFLANTLRPKSVPARVAPLLLALGFSLHTVAVLWRTLAIGTVPATDFGEGLSFFAWLTAGSFLILQSRSRIGVVGAVVSPLVFAMALASVFLYSDVETVPLLLRNPWLPVHVTFAFLGNAVFGLAFAVSVIYLVQERLLKSRKSGHIVLRLPSLEQLDRLNYRCLAWGLPLLTLGIITGGIFAMSTWGSFWSWEPRELLSLITWVLYAALLQFRLTSGLRGRLAATLTIVGFGVLVVSYLSVNLLPLPGRHGGGFGS